MAITDRLNVALAERYRIDSHLGEGGMATVYLAEDLKHDRKVALKVLKPELAAVLGGERFVVEIKTTASLQHPHILPLFDSGTADGFLYYVMPYVEGETLRDRLNRETQLGVDESVRIAADVADALDYAHRHGVIHRDIKPENILLHDGQPIVADFGIALAVSAAAGGRLTETGLSLGTPHYMSPEQATAEKELTGRSDVYSLGCVLYELLTGNPPHTGATAQQIIMKIVTENAVPVTRTRKSVPPNVGAAIAKALEKLPADRFATAAEFRDALRDSRFAPPAVNAAGGAVAAAAPSRSALIGTIAGVAAFAVAAVVWGWLRPAAPAPVVRYQLAMQAGQASQADPQVPTPSPDGSFLVHHGPMESGAPGAQLWMKRRESDEATPIPGTDGAQSFAISPDGAWIVFGSGTQLRKIPVAGGTSVTLVPRGNVAGGAGVAWLDNGTIVFVQQADALPFLSAVSAAGGAEPTVLWRDDRFAGVTPQPLPGSHGVLFARCIAPRSCDLWWTGFDDDGAHEVLPGVANAQYSPTGHLVFVHSSRLVAAEFDLGRKEVRGAQIPLAADVAAMPSPLRLSNSGTLVTRFGAGVANARTFELVWVDRTGRETPVDTAWRFSLTVTGNNHGWSLSPDGRQLAIGLYTEAGDDIWIKQLPRGAASRMTFGPGPEFRPRWTSDGNSVTFVSAMATPGAYQRRADGTGSDSLLRAGPVDEALLSPNGEWLLLRQGGASAAAGGRDITGMRVGRDTAPVPVLATPFDEAAIAVSPDGHWLAYQSDESGRTEVFIRSFPNTNAFKRQVSTSGGFGPVWSRDGRELFYVAGNKQMMAARLSPGSPITVSEPVALFRVPDELLQVEAFYYAPWDVAPDGRFIMARARFNAGSSDRIVVAENWFGELRAKFAR